MKVVFSSSYKFFVNCDFNVQVVSQKLFNYGTTFYKKKMHGEC